MTPLEFAFADLAVTVALIAVMAVLGWVLFAWLPRKWREAGRLVDELADLPARCPYCYGRTIDRGKCNCEDKCTFVPLCAGGTEEAGW